MSLLTGCVRTEVCLVTAIRPQRQAPRVLGCGCFAHGCVVCNGSGCGWSRIIVLDGFGMRELAWSSCVDGLGE